MAASDPDPTDLVWICAHVEQMNETDDYVAIPRTEWDAMTEQQRDAFLTECALTAMADAGGCGAAVVDVSEVPDEERERLS